MVGKVAKDATIDRRGTMNRRNEVGEIVLMIFFTIVLSYGLSGLPWDGIWRMLHLG
jgi:hypothetical protein